MILSAFIIFVYNEINLTKWFGDRNNVLYFIFAAFVMLGILMFIHTGMHTTRKSVSLRKWHYIQYICYFLFMISECWIVAFIMATTDDGTVAVFANTLTAMSIAITAFLSSSKN